MQKIKQTVKGVLQGIKDSFKTEVTIDKALSPLLIQKENLYVKRAEAWKYLTDHKAEVLKAGFTSASDAVNKTLGKDGANRFHRSVNHAKRQAEPGKGKTVKTTLSPLGLVVKYIKAKMASLSAQDLRDVIAVIDTEQASRRDTEASKSRKASKVKVRKARKVQRPQLRA